MTLPARTGGPVTVSSRSDCRSASADAGYSNERDLAGRAAYAERKWLSEAPNGWIEHVLGFRRFSLRGLAKVRGEWDLVCLALNAKRLHALMAA